MKKYLFVVPSISKGGAERVVSILASQLVKKNREATIITHYKTNFDYIVDKHVKIICLSNLLEDDYRKKINVFFLLKMILKLRKSIIAEKPDFIIPFLWTTCIRVDIAMIFNKNKRKVIQTVRNNPNVYPSNILLKWYRNYLVKKSRLTIVQNNEQKNYFNNKSYNKIQIMPNPVSDFLLDIKKSNNKKIITIIGVGRLEEQKNFPLLIKAFAIINKKKPNTILKIYGEGSKYYELNDLIQKLKLDKKVHLCGRCNDYNEIYGCADLFVLSSNFEGMPNTLLEAMATGLPCISTDCPTGPKEIIKNYENGILININDINGLVDSVFKIINDGNLSNKLSINARKTILNKYSSTKITDTFIDICEL